MKQMLNYSLFLLILLLAACSSKESNEASIEEKPAEERTVENEQNEENQEEEEVVQENNTTEEENINEGYQFPEKADLVSTFSDEEVKSPDDIDNTKFRTLKQKDMEPRMFLGDEEVIAIQSFIVYRYDISKQEEMWRIREGIYKGDESQIIDGYLYTYNTEGLIAIDIESGEIVRQYPFDNGGSPRPYFFDETVILSNYFEMKAFDLHTAEEVWTKPLDSTINSAIIENDEAFIYETDLTLYTINKETGDVIWEKERPFSISDQSSLKKYPYVHESSIFVVDYALIDRITTFKELDSTTGEVLNEASFDASHSGIREPLITDNGTLMPTDISQSGELTFLNFALEEQWRIDHAGFVLEEYLYLDGKIYIVAAKGEIPTVGDYHLFVIDAESGEIEEVISLGDGFSNKQLYTNNGKVYIYTNPGEPHTYVYDSQEDTHRPFER